MDFCVSLYHSQVFWESPRRCKGINILASAMTCWLESARAVSFATNSIGNAKISLVTISNPT